MKVGSDPPADPDRVKAARAAIGNAALFVDANGAYEPVSSDDLTGLHLLRVRASAGMRIAAGEHGYDPFYFRRMLGAEASTCCTRTRRERFHDHVRIEQMLSDGTPRAERGTIAVAWSRPGLGIELRRADAERFKVG
jgi:hypothetical protein